MAETVHLSDEVMLAYSTEVVDRAIEVGQRDPEAAHGIEDDLYRLLVARYAPEDIVAEMQRLKDADFPRWYA